MKITETVTRDCCNVTKDIIRMRDTNDKMLDWAFCKYCGRYFYIKETGETGVKKTEWCPHNFPWEL